MAASHSLLIFTLLAVLCAYGHAVYWECPPLFDDLSITAGFDCPLPGQSSDLIYCCDAYETDQHCCDYNAYYGYTSWSLGAIMGVIFGSLIGISLLVTFIIICFVCSGRRQMPHTPVVVSQVQTVPAPQQGCDVLVTDPPSYGEVVRAPPKVGQYQQFTNEPCYPIN